MALFFLVATFKKNVIVITVVTKRTKILIIITLGDALNVCSKRT